MQIIIQSEVIVQESRSILLLEITREQKQEVVMDDNIFQSATSCETDSLL